MRPGAFYPLQVQQNGFYSDGGGRSSECHKENNRNHLYLFRCVCNLDYLVLFVLFCFVFRLKRRG